MLESLNRFLAIDNYLPHGYCLSWSTALLSAFVVSDVLIFLSYFSMPAALLYFARRRPDFPYRWMLWMFSAFMMACGATHLIDVVVLWQPIYGLLALFKAGTALISIVTAIMLWPLLFRALELPSPTQLRLANEKLEHEMLERQRVQQALRLVSDCNAMLVQVEDEQAMLDAICRLIVETGGYRMAWVGFAQHDPEQSVLCVAQSSRDAYLSVAPITWADQERGQGPTALAIRTGTTQINQRYLTDPCMRPWREAALNDGYQSSMALPLVSQGHTIGVLSLYAADADAFIGDEVHLLEELAGNFAYGISTLRMRAMHAEARKELDSHRLHLEQLVIQRTAEYAAAKSEAERANNAKSRFLAAASHDLRQPLAALSLYVGALKNQRAGNDARMVANMNDCVAGLSAMLTDLLDLSKLEAGVVAPNVSDFTLDAIVANLAAAHAPEAGLKGLSFRYGCFNLIGRTDPILFRRIVGNFISNAVRYTERGGVLVGCRKRQGNIWVEVWDTGIGIAADQTLEIFEEFKQLGNNERNRSKGTGLGLAIAAKTATLLGLQIEVRSRPGRGSVFAVELPTGEAVKPSVAPRYTHRPLRIALVEDNAEVAAALVFALSHIGHQVVPATSGAELRTLLDGVAPDIVISDYRLADDESGFDVIASLRTLFKRNLPAIIITGDTDPIIISRMARERISVQHKPLELEALRALLAELSESASAA